MKSLRRFSERRDRNDMALAQHEGFRRSSHLIDTPHFAWATDHGKNSNVQWLAIMAALDRPVAPEIRHDELPAAVHAGCDRRTCGLIAAATSGRPRLNAAAPCRTQGAVFRLRRLGLRAQYFPKTAIRLLETVTVTVNTVRASVGFLRCPDAR